MSKKKEVRSYLEYYTKSEDSTQIVASSGTLNNEGFNLWSFKKLIFLEYYVPPYLNILSSKGYTCFFIDFFSSCGANQIENQEITTIGSPIVSLLKGVFHVKSRGTNNRFKKWFFIDKDEKFCTALKERVLTTLEIINKRNNENLKMGTDVEILCGDCNEKIDSVITQINKEAELHKIAVLAFIDPYKFTNIEWATWDKLLKLRYVDIIFTFPISTIKRGFSQCKNPEKYLPPSLIASCDHDLKVPDEEFERLYAQDIVNLVQRGIHYYKGGIKIKNTLNGELYRIELFTHSGPAMKLTSGIANELEKIKPHDIKAYIEQIFGKLKSLDEFKKE